jgi:hypothetical protein
MTDGESASQKKFTRWPENFPHGVQYTNHNERWLQIEFDLRQEDRRRRQWQLTDTVKLRLGGGSRRIKAVDFTNPRDANDEREELERRLQWRTSGSRVPESGAWDRGAADSAEGGRRTWRHHRS